MLKGKYVRNLNYTAEIQILSFLDGMGLRIFLAYFGYWILNLCIMRFRVFFNKILKMKHQKKILDEMHISCLQVLIHVLSHSQNSSQKGELLEV